MGTPTHFLKTPDLKQKGAGNQGKRLLEQKSMQSGATPPLGYYWREFSECTLPRFSRNRQKKSPVIGFSVPFCVKHSKGFVSALCDQSK